MSLFLEIILLLLQLKMNLAILMAMSLMTKVRLLWSINALTNPRPPSSIPA